MQSQVSRRKKPMLKLIARQYHCQHRRWVESHDMEALPVAIAQIPIKRHGLDL